MEPATKTEYAFFEDMIVARWMLARADWSENVITQTVAFGPKRFDYLVVADRRRTKYERSFERSMENLKKLQKERKAKAATAPSPKPQQPAPPPPVYVMPDSEAQPLHCAPESTDTR